ncbi:MAG: hypothetical protein KME55_14810 [Nostoc indistinguendum CM1-VF10]|jgi:hypothetical protein|nr:hypothetical protein [Nostoc indistinguendum CM1-VF10]
MQDSRIRYKEFLSPASQLLERLRPKRSYAAGFTAALSDLLPPASKPVALYFMQKNCCNSKDGY